MDRLIQDFGYGVIPKHIMKNPKISVQAKGLYAYFCSYAGNKETAFPGVDLITHELDISRNTFYKYLKELREAGYIEVTKERSENGTFKRNIYKLLPCPKKPYMVKPDMETPDMANVDANSNSINNNNLNNNSVNNPILREVLNQLKKIKNYPFAIEKDIEFINSLLMDFPSLDIKEELKKWATYKLDKPLSKTSNARLQFRNWCKNSAKWKAEKEKQNKGILEQPFRQIKSEILLPIEYYKFHGLPIPEEVKKREEEKKKAKEQMPSSEKVSEILRKAKKEILNKKGEDNGSS